jgi:type IV fimbrial biogenesis protein FimT
MKKIAGFTLIEMLTVLLIASIVITVGLPAFRGIVVENRMTASSNELIASLILARSEAIKRNTFVTVCKSADAATCGDDGVAWNEGWIVFSNLSGATADTVDVGDEIIRVYSSLPDGITVAGQGAIAPFVAFRPTGTSGTPIQNLQGTLIICDDNELSDPRGVIVTNSGRSSISHDKAHDDSDLGCA